MFRLAGSCIMIGLLLAAAIVAFPTIAVAQTLRMQSGQTAASNTETTRSNWSGFLKYAVSSDYASERKPRSYNNALVGSLGYAFNENWSLSTEVGARGVFVDGEIEKTEQQSNSEKLSPSTSIELGREGKLFDYHKVSIFVHGEPLWDEISRREGYRGIFGGGGAVTFSLFGARYKMAHIVDYNEINQIYYNSASGDPNPASFISYKFVNSLKLFYGVIASYSFGVKFTRYVDDNTSYAFNNSLGLSKAWGSLSAGLGYENGGFTDTGEVSLWFLDEYRRIFRFTMGYSF